MAFPLTDEQRKIVDDRGGELLVSAAAGSGKTRVLVERLLDRVTKEELDIDSFLVITYTKAAAAELRGRIAQELSARLAQEPGNKHLRRQTTMVYQAQISTIHAFCAALLRENSHLLDLDPDFHLCDEGDAKVLMAQTLEQVLDKRYEGLKEDSPFAVLADTLAAGRDDSRLSEIVLDVFSRIQSHPDPERWLWEQKELWKLEGISDLGQTDWGWRLLEEGRQEAQWCRDQLKAALELADQDELLQQNYSDSLMESIGSLEKFLQANSWDEAAACLPVPFPSAGRKRKRTIELSPMEEERSAWAGERLKSIRTRCKKRLEDLAENMGGTSGELLEELRLSAPAVSALMDLVMDFQRAYASEKRARSLVDFSDLEHMAVQLLLDENGDPTELARYWGARYAEVLVDEYQDTNQVQNAIFTAISNGGRKLFQVGDVKQSIYRFRLADPTIFLDKYDRFDFGDEAQDGMPRKRLLSKNFRSRKEVLLGCNDLFRAIMSTKLGELDYTDDQALVPGAKFPESDQCALELNALDLSFLGEQEGEKDSKDLLEARFIARRIRTMLDEPMMVTEKESLRPIRPSDIMVLLRSPNTVLHHYIRAFEEENITWSAEGGKDLFASTEVNVALSILQIVDNPRQDVALIAALRSPVYGFSEDKLALLRGASKEGDFYTALVNAAENGDQQCQEFLNELETLRFGAGDMTCRQLIWHIYEKTNILGIFGAMPNGGERQNDLLALYALAGQMEDAGCRTLFKFLLRLERFRANGTKLTVPDQSREGEGVSILSIHRSKGLEKPVVLLCGLTRKFNREDFNGPVLFHPQLGVGPKGLDRERMVEYTTVARRAVASQLEKEMLSEELRLLYVAMTRAQDKLILSLPLTDGEKTLEKLGEEVSVPISPMVLRDQPSMGHWILLHALTRPEGEKLRKRAGLPDFEVEDLGPAWDIRWIFEPELAQPTRRGGKLVDLPPEAEPDPELTAALTWQYPRAACVDLPSKLTATQMKGRPVDLEAAEGTEPPREEEANTLVYRPDFAAERRGLTPAQRGTAIHLAAQYIPLEGDHTPAGIEAELDQLEKEGFLTHLQRKAVSAKKLSAFFQSSLGQAMIGAPNCRREFKFSLLTPAETCFTGAEGEEILFQGIIDAWFQEGDGITILDFKSDYLLPGDEAAKAEHYRPQLEAYSEALSRILGLPVKKKVLWFFATDTAYEL